VSLNRFRAIAMHSSRRKGTKLSGEWSKWSTQSPGRKPISNAAPSDDERNKEKRTIGPLQWSSMS
jgi:hypothetical protein